MLPPSLTERISSKKPKFSPRVCTLTLVKHFHSLLNSFSDSDKIWTHYLEAPFCSISPSCLANSSSETPATGLRNQQRKQTLYIKPLRTPCMVGGDLARGQGQGRECCTAIDAVPGMFVTQFSLVHPDSDAGAGSLGSYALSPQACRYYWAESAIILILLSFGKTLPPSYTHTI